MSLAADFDHLVVAVPNLADSVEQCHNVLGVRPIPGGAHPGLGTANALLGLEVAALGPGARTYLEILGPDPDQDPALAAARLSGITAPTVQRWAIRPRDFDGLVTQAARTLGSECGTRVDLGEVHDMTRRTPDGGLLEWRLTRRTPLALGGIQPFLIDWKDSPHPAEQDMPSVELERLWAETPEVDRTRSVLRFLDATLEVEAGDTESLHATLKGPGGSWTL
ncbi:VOC family protein [Brevibacterium atlanticum]|uniref:VOC family protein n=1 Tax=Brevibacterium atlanticum TaxID=2697563 RepID=UPI00141EF18E|nr:VOC family protein [Brevibacterium atlanticum]